jgi:SAM-dependent MidA family methyltransferase
MQPLSALPIPSEAALRHSRALKELIHAELAAAGGWISFEHYMRLVLYAPGRGYYSGGAAKFGEAGDFVTAPEISSLFGRTLARQAAQVLELADDHADILEFGAGTGKLALDLLLELEKLDSLPRRYFILEVSAELQQRQREVLGRFMPHLAPRVVWLECLPPAFDGLILANEVLDAMPVHLVAWHGTDVFERGVMVKGDNFAWSDRPLVEGTLFEAARELSPQADAGSGNASRGLGGDISEYVSEINLSARHFMRSLAAVLQQGAIVLIDYGFGRNEYYHPQRASGTLMCHYRHLAHNDPFYLPGLQDITSHVDFSSVAGAAVDSGLELRGYTTQAYFLINCGVTEILAQTRVENTRDYLPLTNQLQKLVSPAEMGELFKVIAFGKNIHQSLIGFSSGDKSRML